MERATIRTIILDEDMQAKREYLYQEIKDDKRIVDFLEKAQLDDKFLKANIQTFYDWIQTRNIADKCNLDEMCLLDGGYYEDLFYDGILNKQLVPCKHTMYKMSKDSYLNNYIVRHFPDSLADVTTEGILNPNEPITYLEKVAEIVSYLEKPSGHGYYIYGEVGVGKTYLMSAITNVLAKAGKKIAFVHMPTLANDLKSMISRRESIDGLLYKLKNVDVLVLDDIGSEGVSDWLRDDILLSILNYRMESNKTCFYTSNLSMDELFNYYSVNNKRAINNLASQRLLERVRMTSKEINLVGKNRRVYL